MKPFASVLLVVGLSNCCGELEPPSRLVQSLPDGGELIVDVEMWDPCERRYKSALEYVPKGGGAPEQVATTMRKISEVRTVDARPDTVVELTRADAALAAVTTELVLLRLMHGRYGDEVLMVRDESGSWHDHVFREEAYAGAPLWLADHRPFDADASGFSELVRIDTGTLELIVHHYAGWAIRELTFRLSTDGTRVELESLRRLPRDLGRKDVPPGYRDAEIAAAALDAFSTKRTETPDDIRVLESRDCPDGEEGDLARVLFGFPTEAGGHSTELWRFRRIDGVWAVDEVELVDPASIDVLDLLQAEYPRGTRCVQYL